MITVCYSTDIAHALTTTITGKRTLTSSVIELALTSPVPLHYLPGQFVQLRLAGEWRAYTVASMPDDFTVIIVIQLIDGGRASKILATCKVGDDFQMLPPNGWFGCRGGEAACMVGTSTGIIPLYAMLRATLEAGETKALTLLFGARSQQHLFYVDELTALEKRYKNLTVIYCLSKPTAGWAGYEGRVSDYLRKHFSELKNRTFYVSAWHETVETLETQLLRLGVARGDLISEYYD